MSVEPGPVPEADEDAESDDLDRDELAARVDLLAEENERLRDLYAQTQHTAYRRSALGLVALGAIAGAGASLFPAVRDVLAILAAIGLFGGLLTYYLTPERFVAADVTERVYDALATTQADLVADLGLSDARVYLPDDRTATLFVPQDPDAPLPDVDEIGGPLVVTDATRGLAVVPTGARLFGELERTLAGPLGESPGPIARQVTDALVETFEIVDGTDVELDADDGRLTVAFRGSAYPDAVDSPPASLLAVALAVGLDRPIRVETSLPTDADVAVTCRWEPTADETEPVDGASEEAETAATAEPQSEA